MAIFSNRASQLPNLKPWLLPVIPRFVNNIQMAESKQIIPTISFSLPLVNIIGRGEIA
jgi:hypothetical protein